VRTTTRFAVILAGAVVTIPLMASPAQAAPSIQEQRNCAKQIVAADTAHYRWVRASVSKEIAGLKRSQTLYRVARGAFMVGLDNNGHTFIKTADGLTAQGKRRPAEPAPLGNISGFCATAVSAGSAGLESLGVADSRLKAAVVGHENLAAKETALWSSVGPVAERSAAVRAEALEASL
jgi:hypothetical protein